MWDDEAAGAAMMPGAWSASDSLSVSYLLGRPASTTGSGGRGARKSAERRREEHVLSAAALASAQPAGPSSSELWSCNCSSWLSMTEAAAEADEPLSEQALESALASVSTAAALAEARHEIPVFGRLGGEGGMEVHTGLFRGAHAAVKVMPMSSESEAMRHVVEMAVLSSIAHPNIVQAFACLVDMAREEDGGAPSGAAACSAQPPAAMLRFRAADLEEARCNGPCSVVVMELCDQGTLAGALEQRLLSPAAAAALLLDVADAVVFLHAVQLVHGGVRADNVLLKSDPSRPCGLQAKMGGFGRAKILSSLGTPLDICGGAPLPGHAGDMTAFFSDDVAAYGALLLQVLDAFRAHSAPGTALPAAPACAFSGLAAECLAEDPRLRPTMAEVAERVELLASRLGPGSSGPPASA